MGGVLAQADLIKHHADEVPELPCSIYLCHPPLAHLYYSELHVIVLLCLHREDASYNTESVTLGSRQFLRVNLALIEWL